MEVSLSSFCPAHSRVFEKYSHVVVEKKKKKKKNPQHSFVFFAFSPTKNHKTKIIIIAPVVLVFVR